MRKSTFILGILLVASIVAVIIFYRKNREAQKELGTIQEQYQAALKMNRAVPFPIIDTIIDTVAGTRTIIYQPLKTLGPIDGYVSKGLADTLASALKVSVKEIDRLKSMLVEASGKGKGERIKDTVLQTEWLVMKADPVFDVKVNLANDSIYPSAKIRLSQAYAPYRKNIFSRYQYRSAIMASDPRIRISEVYDVNKVPRSPRWGLGVSVGPVISPKGLTWGASLGLSYDIIQF